MEPEGQTGPVTRYQNSMYRVVSMAGAALIVVLGATGLAIGSTLDPRPPASFFIVDAVVTVVLFVWYLLGLRCRLDLTPHELHIVTKYGAVHLDRDDVSGVEADRSVWGVLQWSGRPLVVHHVRDGRVRTRRAYGCLPNAAADQTRVVAELQEALGRPEGRDADELVETFAERLTHGDVDPVASTDRTALESAVAERLSHMTPEGDPSDLGEPTSGPG